MPSKFALAQKNKASNWKKAAKAKPRTGNKFGPADVPDGSFNAVISAKCGVGEKGKLLGKAFVELTASINEGPHLGKEPRVFYVLEGKPISDDPDAMPTAEQQLVGDLKQLLTDIDVEGTLADEPDQLESLIEELESRQVTARIGVRNRIGKKDGKAYQDVYFNEVLSTGEASNGQEESSQPKEEGGEEEGEEEGGEEEGGEEEGGEPDDEPVAPAVGDRVMYQPKGGRKREFVVKTVNQRKQTVTVSDGAKKFSDVSWEALEPIAG